jgi:N-glycosylase/DNA lyase
MDELIDQLQSLQHDESVRSIVDARISEFHCVNHEPAPILFEELCFCIMTANCSAERCLTVQGAVGSGFLRLSEEELTSKFKTLGYRFPPRAKHIVSARCLCDTLPEMLATFTGEERRDWLVRHVDGLGYKEASHFLRNIGYDDYAIIDSHIIDVLVKHGIIKRPKTLTKRKYLEIEKTLNGFAEQAGLTLAQLDLYLWYMETGKILK